MKTEVQNIFKSITKSYSQVFFSDNILFGIFLIIASFFNFQIGIIGIVSSILAIVISKLLGYNNDLIKNGYYTFNAVLAGFALASIFQLTTAFFIILILTVALSIIFTHWISRIGANNKIPFLSIPFVLSIWIVLLNLRHIDFPILQEKKFFYTSVEDCSTNINNRIIGNIGFYKIVLTYLKSMSILFFQRSLCSGIIITIGLLLFSRISFLLSLLGFTTGYVCFHFINHSELLNQYPFIAFNFIFTAISIGGFFLIPSIASFLLAAFSCIIVSLFINVVAQFTGPNYLPIFSLPFSIGVIVLLIALQNRSLFHYIFPVQYQLFSPEKNKYFFHSNVLRFEKNTSIPISLPFYGEWTVSQGHNGNITHLEEYRYAWDFVVTDETKKTFRLPGDKVEDFYCYSLPILAPANGIVVEILDNIDENKIGENNLEQNWGNAIVLKHAECLYSKISHIKKNSFKVKKGDSVEKGDMLALCGNSGRSPEPHIHFQLQSTPFIGSPTLKYPISYYISKQNSNQKLQTFEIPQENDILIRPSSNNSLIKAFNLSNGMILNWEMQNELLKNKIKWEVLPDVMNGSYVYCHNSKAFAYFTNNDRLFYFTHFYGDKNSLLYQFYLGAFKILLSDMQGIVVEDTLPASIYNIGFQKTLQDFISPVFIFLKPKYTSENYVTNVPDSISNFKIKSNVWFGLDNHKNKPFEIEISEEKITKFSFYQNKKWQSAIAI